MTNLAKRVVGIKEAKVEAILDNKDPVLGKE